jgi:N-acetylneuraminic acid mutarotase
MDELILGTMVARLDRPGQDRGRLERQGRPWKRAGSMVLVGAIMTAMAVPSGRPATGQAGAEESPSLARTATGTWKKCKAMAPGAVFAGTVLGPDGRIYVISGSPQYDVKLTAAVRVYHPDQDAWSEVSPIPTPRTEPGAAAGSDGRIYVVGGSDEGHKKNILEAYDPRTDTWTRLSPMPTPRESLCAVAAKGADGRIRIYAIGGRDRSRPGNGLSTVEAYDPATDTWTAMAPMPTPRHAQAATLGPDGCIYVLGGTNDKVVSTDAVEIFDPVKDSWRRGTPMPHGQECAAATSTSGPDGEVLVFAGWDARKRPIPGAVAFHPGTNEWRSLPPVPSARAAGGAVTLERADGSIHVYVLGGTGEDGSGEIHPLTPVETAVEEYVFRPASRRRSDTGAR